MVPSSRPRCPGVKNEQCRLGLNLSITSYLSIICCTTTASTTTPPAATTMQPLIIIIESPPSPPVLLSRDASGSGNGRGGACVVGVVVGARLDH
jgi:hypothetical protein